MTLSDRYSKTKGSFEMIQKSRHLIGNGVPQVYYASKKGMVRIYISEEA